VVRRFAASVIWSLTQCGGGGLSGKTNETFL